MRTCRYFHSIFVVLITVTACNGQGTFIDLGQSGEIVWRCEKSVYLGQNEPSQYPVAAVVDPNDANRSGFRFTTAASYVQNGRYNWNIRVESDDGNTDEIRAVELILPPGLNQTAQPKRVARFAFEISDLGELPVTAKITLKDGRTQFVSHMLRADAQDLSRLPRIEMSIENDLSWTEANRVRLTITVTGRTNFALVDAMECFDASRNTWKGPFVEKERKEGPPVPPRPSFVFTLNNGFSTRFEIVRGIPLRVRFKNGATSIMDSGPARNILIKSGAILEKLRDNDNLRRIFFVPNVAGAVRG